MIPAAIEVLDTVAMFLIVLVTKQMWHAESAVTLEILSFVKGSCYVNDRTENEQKARKDMRLRRACL